MRDERWIEVRGDFESAIRHFEKAQKLYVQGTKTANEEDEQTFALAFMHAMQAGYTSLESGMVRIMRMVDEVVPDGKDWHDAVVKRMTMAIDGKRPVFLGDAGLANAVDETRKFRHVASHTYDDFNWAEAKRPVQASEVIAGSLLAALQRFQRALDPSDDDGSGGGASGGPPMRPR